MALSPSADDEFLEKIGNRRCAYTDQGVFKSESDSIAIFGCVVDVGDCAGRQAADEAGVIRLPVAIIAFANHGLGESAKNS
jgi:hypothetical protein